MTRTPPHSPPFPTTPPLRTNNGRPANGGVDLDQSANPFTINVTSVNDAPAGTDNAKTINEDGTYTFAAADFGFSDPNDSPANTLQDRKSTRLNSSHLVISYAVFCLKKKKRTSSATRHLAFTVPANSRPCPVSH